MASIYHVNFHTLKGRPVLLDDAYARFVDETLGPIVSFHRIVCLARTVMPTHVHCIVISFSNQPRGRIVQLLKGGSAHAFLARFPEWRSEIGDHLWQEGYHWVSLTTHSQLLAAIKYAGDNGTRVGLGQLNDTTPFAEFTCNVEGLPSAESCTMTEALQ